VAEKRIVATGEDRRHPAAALGEPAMADRVDPAMDWEQAAGFDSAVDRLPPEAGLKHLAARDDAVLTGCQLDNVRLSPPEVRKSAARGRC